MKYLYLIGFLCCFISTNMLSKDYDASLFGIESDGRSMNTNSIQKAINFIHKQGGGRLIFHVGRYLSGSIYLRSNVTLHLKEGAVLLGSTNPFDYEYNEEWTAFIFGLNQDSIAITGKGIIDGQGYQVAQNLVSLIQKGVVEDPRFSNDRPYARIRPQNIYFKGCRHILIQGIQVNNPASWNQQFDQCSHLIIDQIKADCKNYWNNDGIDIVDCDSVIVKNSFFDASDDAICLKSHHPKFRCKDILIYNNTIRSSASAIKFGTYTFGGCQNIKIIKNTVYDTYRSAISFQMMDGNHVENILIDSLRVINTGNVFFFRLGERKKGKVGSMKNIQISNVYAEITADKGDKGYLYEGPIEHMPRNCSPAVITGLAHAAIENISFRNMEIHYPGGADSNFAKIDLNDVQSIAELPSKYPEYSMFKELPAWGFYIRHARQVRFENIRMTVHKADFRPAFVLDDVQDGLFQNFQIKATSSKWTSLKDLDVYKHRCQLIEIIPPNSNH